MYIIMCIEKGKADATDISGGVGFMTRVAEMWKTMTPEQKKVCITYWHIYIYILDVTIV